MRLPPVCLIGGSGRSGTTILKHVFARHPRLIAAPEYRFTVDPDGLADFLSGFDGAWTPYLYDQRVRRLDRMLRRIGASRILCRAWAWSATRSGIRAVAGRAVVPSYAGLHIADACPGYALLVDELIQALRGRAYTGHWVGLGLGDHQRMAFRTPSEQSETAGALAAFWGKFLIRLAESAGRERVVEDNTWNILWFDALLRLNPAARLVHVVRDPRDIVASYLRMPWAPDAATDAARWLNAIYERWGEIRDRVPPDSYLEIRLEDLIESPEATLNRVCLFWGLGFDDALLTVDLSKGHVGRWRKELTPTEQQAVADVLSDQIRRHKYEDV